MDELSIKKREIFYNNLVLLGLDCQVFEKKHGIAFNKDMFALPNKKGFQVVTHFLFFKLSAATGQDFNIPWPLLRKECERAFFKTVYSHLSSFAQENIFKFPNIVPSLLSTFGGTRFYDAYFAFSSYVMFKTLKNAGCPYLLSMPTMTQENTSLRNMQQQIVQLSTLQCVQSVRYIGSFTYASHLVWTRITKTLSECLSQLKGMLKEKESLKQRNMKSLASLISVPVESVTVKRLVEEIYECYKPKMRKSLETFCSTEAGLWPYLATEIGEGQENQVLDGQNLGICANKDMPEECRLHLEKTGFTTSTEDKKLSVERFIQLLEGFLKFITQVIIRADLSKLHESCSVEEASSMNENLHYVGSLIKRLNEKEIPDIEENIQEKKLIFDDLHKDFKPLDDNLFPSLPILRFDPESVKARMTYFNPEEWFNSAFTDSEKPEEPFGKSSLDASSTEILLDSWSSRSTVGEACVSVSSFSKDVSFANTAEVSAEDCLLSPSSGVMLTDLNYCPSKEYEMRKSWLEEPSLNSETMPKMFFDDW